jgi:hypothetical protein
MVGWLLPTGPTKSQTQTLALGAGGEEAQQAEPDGVRKSGEAQG